MNREPQNKKILIIDDEPDIVKYLGVLLEDHNYTVVSAPDGEFCWVDTPQGPQRRSLKLGDTDDSYVIVTAGLREGDAVILNPLALIEEAQAEGLKPLDNKQLPDAAAEGASADGQQENVESEHGD